MKSAIFGSCLMALMCAVSVGPAQAKFTKLSDTRDYGAIMGRVLDKYLQGTTHVFQPKAGGVWIYHFFDNHHVAMAKAGEKSVQTGTWSVRGAASPQICISSKSKGRSNCHKLSSAFIRSEIGACPVNRFELPNASSESPVWVQRKSSAGYYSQRCHGLRSPEHIHAMLTRKVAPSSRTGTKRQRSVASITKDIRQLYAGVTVVAISGGHGVQIEYHSPNGRANLSYPTNQRMLPGRWSVNGRSGVCYNYGSNTYNPVTRNRSGTECTPIKFLLRYGHIFCRGDVFGLNGRVDNPFGPGKKRARSQAAKKCLLLSRSTKDPAYERLLSVF